MSLSRLTTEKRNPLTNRIDEKSTLEILTCINNEDHTVADAVETEIPQITTVVDAVVKCMKNDGRLVYVGCGSSGRLGVIDAVECSVTYGVPDGKVIGVIAGGVKALRESVEIFEDSEQLAVEDLSKIDLNKNDAVVGLAASGRTPYVLGALKHAKSLSCFTAAVVCNRDSLMSKEATVTICSIVGPEVIAGSTRMKAGTAQKLILNMISTAVMIKLGKCYGNLMIDLKADTCSKLRDRALRIFCELTECGEEEGVQVLKKCNWELKTAVLLSLKNFDDPEQSRVMLNKCHGNLKQALNFSHENHVKT